MRLPAPAFDPQERRTRVPLVIAGKRVVLVVEARERNAFYTCEQLREGLVAHLDAQHHRLHQASDERLRPWPASPGDGRQEHDVVQSRSARKGRYPSCGEY